MEKAKSIMIQGTASNVGKSVLVAGLCRIFKQDGFSVAPFKAQNMALNSFVTFEGLEMGRAQVTQAQACKILPDVRMNPILLKPNSDTGSQIIVNGKASGNLEAKNYYKRKNILRPVVKKAYESLANEYDIIVMEGAGSCAEINLRKNDIVNMNAAIMAEASVLIAGDIDRGGVFAHFVGTHTLMLEEEKKLIKGFLINKFRGDASLLDPAINFVQEKTGVPTLGIIPWLRDINIPDEDSVEFKKSVGKRNYDPEKTINIALIDLPHISNFTDFDAFDIEEDVNLVVVDNPETLEQFDWIIIPGSKNTIGDMKYLEETRFAEKIKSLSDKKTITGICGGYQILGKTIEDKESVEANVKCIMGLNLMNHKTIFEPEKYLSQTKGKTVDGNFEITGYEIHHGKTFSDDKVIFVDNNNDVLGTENEQKNIWGTYLHGIFDNDRYRNFILNKIRKEKGALEKSVEKFNLDKEFDKLADMMRESMNIKEIYKIMGIEK